MKRVLISCIILLLSLTALGQGLPFIRHFNTDDYKAHAMNFDLDIDKSGIVYVANFEGLLYYDNVRWRILHTPGLSRLTVVFCDSKGNVWTGGYNFFGKVVVEPNGTLALQDLGKQHHIKGEILEIWEEDNGVVYFISNNGNIYEITNNQIKLKEKVGDQVITAGLTDIIDSDALIEKGKVEALTDTLVSEPLDNGLTATVRKGQGLFISDQNGRILYALNEATSMPNNNITYIKYDHHGTLWGVMDNGIFAIAVPSAYSHFTNNDGLSEGVISIAKFKDNIYAGTLNGLFRLQGTHFVNVGLGNFACWELSASGDRLLAATATGIYLIKPNGTYSLISPEGALSVYDAGDVIYSGEMGGLFTMTPDGKNRKKVCNLEKVSGVICDKHGDIWIQNVYGQVMRQNSDKKFIPYNESAKESTAVLVQFADTIRAIDALATYPIPFPQFSYFDGDITWLTNNEGTQLYAWRNGKEVKDLDYLYPFKGNTISALLHDGHQLWLGNNKGFSIIDTDVKDPAFLMKPVVHIRSIGLGSDTILWGGFGPIPEEMILDSKERNIHFTYALNNIPIVNMAYYRYQLNDGRWSAWTTEQHISFYNLPYGDYTFRVEGLDAFGHKTDTTEFSFSISYPFYLRWYMIILYLLAAGFILYLIYKMRIRMLQKEKLRLEQVVQERTAEIVKQKDEIQEKSESLELTLNELHSAQNQLIRQEKLATVGKLTQGLIDRILNPLNYINNFSKLSEGLVRDVEANIEDEKEHMSEDNYEDTIDVLGMLKGNLQKVGEHGQNTTRTLKAMEEMLRDRSGGIVKTDVTTLFKHNQSVVDNYYGKQIAAQHINVVFDYPSEPIFVNANPELLSKVFMSLLGNSFYAAEKKFTKGSGYSPEVSLKAEVVASQLVITIHDNGIGIEESILDKIFDPFFTTKTTGEAAGIGLYLSHDIIQSYGGTITVNSVKDQFADFTITLPIIKD